MTSQHSHRCIICYFLLFILFQLSEMSSNVNPPPLGIRVMNDSNLAQWYDPLALCILHAYKENLFPLNYSYSFALDHCKNELGEGRYPMGFKVLPSSSYTNKVRSVCCTEDIPLTDRGFDWVIDGYEDSSATPVLNMLVSMSKKNLSMLLMGDSVNRQYYAALVEELTRENGTHESVGTYRTFTMPSERSWFNWPLDAKVLASFPQCSAWTPNPARFPELGPNPNTVYLYDLNMWFMALWGELWARDKIIPQLLLNDHPSGLVFMANLGHHLAAERKGEPTNMYMKISTMLNWMYAMSVLSPGSLMVWRESTPSHFNSPDRDGSFEKWEHADPSYRFYYAQPNYWDNTFYGCRAMEFNLPEQSQLDHPYNTPYNATAVADLYKQAQTHQFRENTFAKEILALWECWDTTTKAFTCDAVDDFETIVRRPTRHNIRVLRVFEFLSPFAGMKYGNCGGYDRVEAIDCVHYCGNALPMWMPVWVEMERMIEEHVGGYDQRLSTHGHSVGNVTDSAQWFQRLPTVWGYVPQADIEVVRCTETDQLYVLFHGVKRLLSDLPSLADEMWEMNSDTIDPADPASSYDQTIRKGAFNVSAVEIARVSKSTLSQFVTAPPVPAKFHPVDGTAIQVGGRGAIWLVSCPQGACVRREFPDWDTYVSMGYSAKGATQVGQQQANGVPLGEPLPVQAL